MEKLWSPWRSKYIESFKPGAVKEDGCLFCRVKEEKDDVDNLIIHREKKSFIIMNLFPYNSGHLMVVPYQHASTFNELDDETSLECMLQLKLCCDILNNAIHPHGFNIGSNIGRIAGAGIEDHVHFHIVPRWTGDSNFMPIINDVKVISEAMEDTYKKLKKSLEKILSKNNE
ncbi:MAG TPA: HIT domain-containing protein [Ignavibacteria bacterium]|jgi:ATP adenylyltransferase